MILHWANFFCEVVTSSLAVIQALIMLLISALPVPAKSTAVPWSTDVRMKGNPNVIFTACPNPEYFSTYSILGDYYSKIKNNEKALSNYSIALTKEINELKARNAINKKIKGLSKNND